MAAIYSTDPLHVAVSKSKGITIDWADSHISRFTCALLRDACPCASCTGAHGADPQPSNYSAAVPNAASGPFPMFKPVLKMDSIEEVGAYAIRIHWNDNHDSGIYSFAYLRTICPCPECELARQQGHLTAAR
jgi:DUF971 family protein